MRAQRDDPHRPRAAATLLLAPTAVLVATSRAGRTRRRLRSILLASVVALVATAWLLPSPSAQAQSEPDATAQDHRALHPEAREAISKLRSPFCPGLMLEVCPSLDAQLLRDSLDAQARDGTSADSLVERMVAAYGEEYRAFPKRTGTGLLAWAVPPAGLLAGLGLVVVALRRLRGSAQARAAREGLTSEEEARLAAAMAEFDAMEEADA